MSVLEKIEKARQTVSDLCEGRITWTMRVPAEPDRDPDLIIAGALGAAKEHIELLEQVEANVTTLHNIALDRIAELERQKAELVKANHNDGLEKAAEWVDRRRWDYEKEFGSIDPSTGTLEFGRIEQEEYASELAEIAEGIRAMKANTATATDAGGALP